ncbi:hypothetical protein HDE_12518 [Halotydeus destructor]|nr:hypothetical protein HDE_12518 [Halotydeus destructor]
MLVRKIRQHKSHPKPPCLSSVNWSIVFLVSTIILVSGLVLLMSGLVYWTTPDRNIALLLWGSFLSAVGLVGLTAACCYYDEFRDIGVTMTDEEVASSAMTPMTISRRPSQASVAMNYLTVPQADGQRSSLSNIYEECSRRESAISVTSSRSSEHHSHHAMPIVVT